MPLTTGLDSGVLEQLKFFGVPGLAIVAVVSVVCLIGSIFIATKNVPKIGTTITFVLFGSAAIVSILAISILLNVPTYAWIDVATRGDWGGGDEFCSKGRLPLRAICDVSRAGQVAVCWSNRPTGYPPGVDAECRGERAWCTYKTMETLSVTSTAQGSSSGRVFVCARTTY
jgi:hypothetical protein